MPGISPLRIHLLPSLVTDANTTKKKPDEMSALGASPSSPSETTCPVPLTRASEFPGDRGGWWPLNSYNQERMGFHWAGLGRAWDSAFLTRTWCGAAAGGGPTSRPPSSPWCSCYPSGTLIPRFRDRAGARSVPGCTQLIMMRVTYWVCI